MNDVHASPKPTFRVSARESDSPVVEINDVSLKVTHPDERRSGVGHHLKAFFALAQSEFGFPPSRSLPQQSCDQQRLENNYRDAGKNVFLVSIPNCRLSVQNDRAGRQRRLGYVPLDKFPPIDVHAGPGIVNYGYILSLLAGEKSRSYFGCLGGLLTIIWIRPTDTPMADAEVLEDAVFGEALSDSGRSIAKSDLRLG